MFIPYFLGIMINVIFSIQKFSTYFFFQVHGVFGVSANPVSKIPIKN